MNIEDKKIVLKKICENCKYFHNCAISLKHISPMICCSKYKRKKIKEDYIIYWIFLSIKNRILKIFKK